MNKMKKSRKLLVVLLALSMIIAVFPLTAFAGVTDTGDGSIIRTTTTNYYTTVKIEGTFIAAGATTPETFTDSSAEITGNTGDADVQTEINRLKEAFRNWAGEKNATEINFDNEAVSLAYYEVHDEIVNSKDNIVTVTICTVLDRHQIYTITASAKQDALTPPEEPNILPAFSGEQSVTAGIGAFEEPHFIELGENEEIKNVTGTISYTLTDGTVFTTSNELKTYLANQAIGTVISVDYLFIGNGEYTDFMDTGTLKFTMVSGVDDVDITIDVPKKGEALPKNATITGTAAGATIEKECLVVKDVKWIGTSDTIAAANTEYTVSIVIKTDRGVYFAGDINNINVKINGVEIASKDKSLFTDENTNELTVVYKFSKTEAEDNDTTQPVYKFIEGANSSWMQNDDGTLTFRANGDFDKFTGVKVDGLLIDEKYYSAVSGSTVVTLKNDYLKTLAVGTHSLTVTYTDGDCSTNFEIKSTQNPVINEQTSDPNTQPTSPQTGDNSNMLLWVLLLATSGAVLTGTAIYSKKRRHS